MQKQRWFAVHGAVFFFGHKDKNVCIHRAHPRRKEDGGVVLASDVPLCPTLAFSRGHRPRLRTVRKMSRHISVSRDDANNAVDAALAVHTIHLMGAEDTLAEFGLRCPELLRDFFFINPEQSHIDICAFSSLVV